MGKIKKELLNGRGKAAEKSLKKKIKSSGKDKETPAHKISKKNCQKTDEPHCEGRGEDKKTQVREAIRGPGEKIGQGEIIRKGGDLWHEIHVGGKFVWKVCLYSGEKNTD